jgi:hypothetical protein
MRSSALHRILLSGITAALFCTLFTGCATRVVTSPKYVKLREAGYNDKILAIMPYGDISTDYGDRLRERNKAIFYNRWLFGKGEISVPGEPYTFEGKTVTPEGPYEQLGEVIYNRLRGYNAFKHVVMVKDRQEADAINADFLMIYHINKWYARNLGANLNLFEWITYEGTLDVDIVVYDLVENRRIKDQQIESKATSTSVWEERDVRAYERRRLLKGTTANNAIADITF